MKTVKIVRRMDVPDAAIPGEAYLLPPNPHPNPSFYGARTSRHIGWMTEEEQAVIRRMVVAIGGVGGMGGSLVEMFSRFGVGEIRFADPETFDASNLNRQYGARESTIGRSKALETARRVRGVLSDQTLVIYPDGVTATTAPSLLKGADLAFAEIEVFAIHPYVLFHQQARRESIPVYDGLVIGWGTNAFYFDPIASRVEDMLGWTGVPDGIALREAAELQEMLREDPSTENRRVVIGRVLDAFVPNLPSYRKDGSDREAVLARLLEGQASILAPVPPLAAETIAIAAILRHLDRCGFPRKVDLIPAAPSFLTIDPARCSAEIVRRDRVSPQEWWKGAEV